MDFNTLFQGFNDKKVLIVGDAMIDAYMWGEVNRMSPEAPVPVVVPVNDEVDVLLPTGTTSEVK